MTKILGLSVFVLSTALAAAASTETVSLSDLKSAAATFKGQINDAEILYDSKGNEKPAKGALYQEYGIRTFTAFEKHPELVAALRKLNGKFDPHTIATSGVSATATIDGKTFLILKGCFPHNCGGTEQIIAIEPATKKVYMLQPTNLGPNTEPSGKFYVYGDPDPSLRALLYKAYVLEAGS